MNVTVFRIVLVRVLSRSNCTLSILFYTTIETNTVKKMSRCVSYTLAVRCWLILPRSRVGNTHGNSMRAGEERRTFLNNSMSLASRRSPSPDVIEDKISLKAHPHFVFQTLQKVSNSVVLRSFKESWIAVQLVVTLIRDAKNRESASSLIPECGDFLISFVEFRHLWFRSTA